MDRSVQAILAGILFGLWLSVVAAILIVGVPRWFGVTVPFVAGVVGSALVGTLGGGYFVADRAPASPLTHGAGFAAIAGLLSLPWGAPPPLRVLHVVGVMAVAIAGAWMRCLRSAPQEPGG